MKTKERYVLVLFKDIHNLKGQKKLVYDYLQKGNCIQCEAREGCPIYAQEMLDLGIRMIPFGKSLENMRMYVATFSLSSEVEFMVLFDNKDKILYIYQMKFNRKNFEEEILKEIAEEYDGLFSDTPIKQYCIHDLREVMSEHHFIKCMRNKSKR